MAFSDFFKKGGGKNSANAAKIGKTAQERKDISIEILKSQGVPYIDHLPLRYETSEITPREKNEVIARAICSCAAPYKFVAQREISARFAKFEI